MSYGVGTYMARTRRCVNYLYDTYCFILRVDCSSLQLGAFSEFVIGEHQVILPTTIACVDVLQVNPRSLQSTSVCTLYAKITDLLFEQGTNIYSISRAIENFKKTEKEM